MPADLPGPDTSVVELQQTVDRLKQEIKQLRSQNQRLLNGQHHKPHPNSASSHQSLGLQPTMQTPFETQVQLQLKLLDAVAQAVIATDLNGKILYWNRHAEALYGWSASEVLGCLIVEIVPAEITRDQATEIMTHLQQGEQCAAEFLVQRKDGSTFIAWVMDSPIYDDQGSLMGIVGVSIDISDRKRAEAEQHQTALELESAYLQLEQSYHDLTITNAELTVTLQELQSAESQLLKKAQELDQARQQTEHERQRYQDLFNFAPDGYLVTDRAGIIQEVNQAAIALLCPDRGADYLAGLPLRLFVNQQQISFFRTCLDQIQSVNQTYSFELNLHASQTRQDFPAALIVSGIADTAGNLTGLQWSIRDITPLKRVEQALQETNNKLENTVKIRTTDLQQAERRWRTLLENVHLLVVGLDQAGQITYANPFFLELTHYRTDEVINQDWFTKFMPPSQRASSREYFHNLLNQPNTPLQHQAPLLTRSGEERIIAWNHTLLWDGVETAIGTMSIGEDITERFAVDRMKTEFIAVVSHELRTPLAAIHGGLQLLAKGIVPVQTEQGQTLLQVASENSQRLVRLINDILELERLESGKSPLQKYPCRTQELTRQISDTLQFSLQEAGITLEVSDPDIEIVADCDRIHQVLTNLLNNAIKFSPANTTLWLTVAPFTPETDESQAMIVFNVRDQGRGIPAEKLESIFDRFIQVDSSDSRQKGGTGLGLSICRNIVEQHGGTIWAESIPGEGSCFYFTLPVS